MAVTLMVVLYTLLNGILLTSSLPKQRRQITDHGNTQIKPFTVQECNKETFVKTYLYPGKEKGRTLYENDYEKLRGCVDYNKKCSNWPGTLSTSVMEDTDGKVKILFELDELTKQDCWGYAIQRTFYHRKKSKEITETYYFNFDENEKATDFAKLFPTKWGTKYNITVYPLPTGKPLSVTTISPTKCQLNVMVRIYKKIASAEFFKYCTTVPDYETRRQIAEEICGKQTDSLDAATITEQHLVEENCKFLLK